MKNKTDNPLRMYGLYGTLGFEIVACILGGVYLGKYLDELFQTEPVWLTVGILTGFIFGIVSAAFTLKAFIKD